MENTEHQYEWLKHEGPVHLMARRHRLQRRVEARDVSGPFWLVAVFRPTAAKAVFHASTEVLTALDTPYVLAYPPGSVIHATFSSLVQNGVFVFGERAPPPWLPATPVILKLSKSTQWEGFNSWAAFEPFFAELPWADAQPIGRTAASALVKKTSRYIDAHFRDPELRIGALGERFGTAAAHLSRAFRAELGLPPKQYLSRLRIMAATFELTRSSVIDAGLASGFGDLSRFNKQFRDVAKTTPRALQRRKKVKKRPD